MVSRKRVLRPPIASIEGMFLQSEQRRRVLGIRRGGGGGAAYDPSQESPILHLRASEGVTLDTTFVESWAPYLGAGPTFTKVTDGSRPTYDATGMNGHPTVDGNGSNLGLAGTGISETGGDYVLIAALNIVGPSAAQGYLLDFQTGRLIFETDIPSTANVGHYDGAHRSHGAYSTGNQILRFVMNSASGAESFKDGVSIGTATYSAKNLGGTIGLLAQYTAGSSGANVKLAELLLFNSLDATRDAAVEAFLTDRYIP